LSSWDMDASYLRRGLELGVRVPGQ
jgi:hypothetical protein